MPKLKERLKSPYVRMLLFVAGFLVAHFAIQAFFYNYVKYRANLRYRLEKMFETEVDTLDHLFIGSSHTNKGIAIDSFQHAFKFFGPTETAPYHYYRAKKLLETHDGPIRQIIVPAEPGVLGFNPQPLQYLGVYWIKYINFRELGSYTNFPFYYSGLGLKIQLFPYHQHPAALLVLRDLKKQKVIWRYFQKPSWQDYSMLERQMIMSFLLDRHFTFGSLVTEPGIAYFKKMTELSEKYNVQMIFLKYPLRPEYYENVGKLDPRVMEYDQWIDSLVRATPNAHMIDAMKMYNDHPDLYMDPHHLNKKGKAVFSGWLNDTLDVLQQKKAAR